MGSFASRICGSSDLYRSSGKGPACSLNFVTSHDGFTLNDLVSYKQKHNDENGEYNRDGTDANYSDNCGVEGASDDPVVEGMRNRLIKNIDPACLSRSSHVARRRRVSPNPARQQ